jgi:ATP-binding cassette subfamily B protein
MHTMPRASPAAVVTGLSPARSPAAAIRACLSPYRIRYAAGAAALLTATLLALAIPWTVKHAVDALERDAAAAPLARYVLIIVLLAVAHGAARLASRLAILGGAQHVEFDLRNELYASLQAYSPGFYAAHRTGDLMARASSDVAAVKSLVGFGTLSLGSTLLAFGGALTAMLAVDPWLTLLAMVPYPVLILLAKRANTVMHQQTEAVQDQLGILSARVQEYLAGIGVVRAYAMEASATADFAAANTCYLRRGLRLARTQSQFAPLMALSAGLGTLVVLWAGGKWVIDGRLTLGALVAFNGYLAYLAWPTMALGWTLSIVRRGLTSMGRILEIIDGAPPLAGGAGAWEGPASIGFRGLTFRYGDVDVLTDVRFTVEPGQMVAVVGATGSGKSTLGLLLSRLWEPPPGTVFVGERDVTRMPLPALRTALGYVPQEAFLFSRSILDNVTLGREDVTPAQARAAAELAGIADEIEGLPNGWQTVVGERGLTLSGGQRQRVALARALASAPPILVLDDVFASVDAVKEDEIVESLRRIAPGRTVLLMTHRLRVAQIADRIVVLAQGRVAELGRHDDLVRAGGLYAHLWRRQQLEAEIARA